MGAEPSDVAYVARGGAVLVPVKVVPGASRTRVVGPLGDRLKVAVASAPEHGRANEEVCRLLAGRLGVAASAVRVVAGASSPRKTVEVAGCDVARARAALEGGNRA
jgi:uncharacterized protein (TIGR00251 family)